MKKLKISAVFWVCLSLVFAFAGCGESGKNGSSFLPIETYEKAAEKYTFIDETETVSGGLPLPARKIEDREDFAYALDYLSFYRIGQRIAFDISEDYASSISAIYPELCRAAEEAQLVEAYPVTLDSEYYRKWRIVAVTLRIVDVATVPPAIKDETAPFVLPFDYNPELNARPSDYDEFSINNRGQGCVEVETSEQLWYSVSKGYIPLSKEGSVAKRIYDEAKSVLRRIISDDMSEYEKAKSIYNFLCCEVRYDRETLASGSVDLTSAQCYYLEGVFFNRYAVCDGKAKAYCLLGGMEGLEVLRATDFNEDLEGHAYNYVKVEGKWYLSCSTFGSALLDFGDGETSDKRVISTYNMFLTDLKTPYGEDWGYDSAMYADIAASIGKPFDYWARPIGNTQYDLTVSSAEEWLEVVGYIAAGRDTLGGTQIEIKLTGVSLDEIRAAAEEAYADYQMEFVRNRPLEENLYGCIFLK